MEGLNPTLQFVFCLQSAIVAQRSLRDGARAFLSPKNRGPLFDLVAAILMARDQGRCANDCLNGIKSDFQRALLEVFLRGLEGESIGPRLIELRAEIERAIEEEIHEHVMLVPFRCMLPLLLLQVPALLFLIGYPLLRDLLAGLTFK
jgi:hypothetical protein